MTTQQEKEYCFIPIRIEGEMITEQQAYELGKNASKYGATEINSHYSIFAIESLRDAWQRGYDEETENGRD